MLFKTLVIAYKRLFRHHFYKQGKESVKPLLAESEVTRYKAICCALEGRFVIIPKLHAAQVFSAKYEIHGSQDIEFAVLEPDTFKLVAVVHFGSMSKAMKKRLKEHHIPIVEVNIMFQLSIVALRHDILAAVGAQKISVSETHPISNYYH